MSAVAQGVADRPEDPVHDHRRPYAQQSEMEYIGEQVGRSDAEDPHGADRQHHRPDHIARGTQGIGNGKGRHPEQDRHNIMETHHLDRHLRRLRSQVIQLHQERNADEQHQGHGRRQGNGELHHFSGIIAGLRDLARADADGGNAHQPQVDGGAEKDVPARQGIAHRVRRDGGGAHGGHHAEHHDLAQLEHAVFQAVWHGDVKDPFDQDRIEAEAHLSAEIDVPGGIEHHHHDHHSAHVTGDGGGNGRARHAPFQAVDADGVSDQVDRIDQQGDPHGDPRVVHGAEYGGAGIVYGKPGEGNGRDDQVGFGRLHHIVLDLAEHQPQQPVMEGDEDDRDRQSQAGCEHQDLPGHPAGLLLMLLPQIMPGDHGPARRQGGENIDE